MTCPECDRKDPPFSWKFSYCDYCYELKRDDRDRKIAASELHVSVGEDIHASEGTC